MLQLQNMHDHAFEIVQHFFRLININLSVMFSIMKRPNTTYVKNTGSGGDWFLFSLTMPSSTSYRRLDGYYPECHLDKTPCLKHYFDRQQKNKN